MWKHYKRDQFSNPYCIALNKIKKISTILESTVFLHFHSWCSFTIYYLNTHLINTQLIFYIYKAGYKSRLYSVLLYCIMFVHWSFTDFSTKYNRPSWNNNNNNNKDLEENNNFLISRVYIDFPKKSVPIQNDLGRKILPLKFQRLLTHWLLSPTIKNIHQMKKSLNMELLW